MSQKIKADTKQAVTLRKFLTNSEITGDFSENLCIIVKFYFFAFNKAAIKSNLDER